MSTTELTKQPAKVLVKSKQGQTRLVEKIDLPRWKRKGYLPTPSGETKKK